MPTQRKSKSGTSIGRRRVPVDVPEEYGRHHGEREEVKFSASATTKAAEAKRLCGEWLAEHEARVAAMGRRGQQHETFSGNFEVWWQASFQAKQGTKGTRSQLGAACSRWTHNAVACGVCARLRLAVRLQARFQLRFRGVILESC